MIAKLERRLSWRNQDCAIEIAILRKSTIKSYDFISSGVCKRSQPCIAPYVECQSEPDIDVSEKSHRRPDTPQSLRWLSAVVPEFQNKQAGTERDIRKVLIQPTQPRSIRRLAYPRVRELLRRLRSCRYGLYHDFSCTHYHAISHRNQDTILRGGNKT